MKTPVVIEVTPKPTPVSPDPFLGPLTHPTVRLGHGCFMPAVTTN
jgi:hypothetical protein